MKLNECVCSESHPFGSYRECEELASGHMEYSPSTIDEESMLRKHSLATPRSSTAIGLIVTSPLHSCKFNQLDPSLTCVHKAVHNNKPLIVLTAMYT
jgi:hypothetical protein